MCGFWLTIPSGPISRLLPIPGVQASQRARPAGWRLGLP